MKYMYILVVILLFTSFTSLVTANMYPGAKFMNGNITVTFSQEVTADFISIGTIYLQLDNSTLTVTCTNDIEINVSQSNSGRMLKSTESILRFNATYTGTVVTFIFSNADSYNITYSLYTDGVFTATYDSAPFTFINYDWSTHDFDIRGIFYPDPPYNASSVYTSYLNTINLTWNRAADSDIEILRMKVGSYPSSPTDGTLIQSSTIPYYNFTITDDQYYTVWSLNSTSGQYSLTGLNLPWGGVNN